MSLKQAYDLIKAGDKESAVQLLLPVLKADENNASAWWLMANALTDPQDIREALENVLRLHPEHAQAQKKLDKLNAMYPPPKPQNDDFDFDFDEEYIEDERNDFFDVLDDDDGLPIPPASGPRRTSSKSSKPNALLIVLAVVGGLTLMACAACVALPMIGVSIMGGAIEEAVADMANDPDFTFSSSEIPANAVSRGSLRRGDVRQATVDTWVDDRWTFEANAGDQLSILVNTLDNTLDPQLSLFGPSGNLIAENDDIDLSNDNYNSRVDVTLPSTGTYTIIVSAFGFGGLYEIILN